MKRSSTPSTKKIARLAQRGKGRRVRFQGGTLFPVTIVVVLALGTATVIYARESRPDPGSFPPQVGDHWHAAYGIYACDTWLAKFRDDKEEQRTDRRTGAQEYVDQDFALTGIHSHAEGVIHYHPFSTAAVGKRARLGVFLDVYDVELSATRLKVPDSEGGNEYDLDNGFRCGGEDTEIKVVAWDSFSDTGRGQTYITDLDDVPVRNDGMAFAIAVVPRGEDVAMPPWASDLPRLGAADGGNVPTTTIEGQAPPVDATSSVPAVSSTTPTTSTE